MNNNNRDDTEEYRGQRRITTDRKDIQRWADERDAALISGAESGTAEPSYQFVPEADAKEEHREKDWDNFFDWFESENRAFVYTEDADGMGTTTFSTATRRPPARQSPTRTPRNASSRARR